MKKILKSLGIIGLIIGVLSPFISLPKVNAADDCEHYLNQYLFLDRANGNGFEHYTNNSGYTTHTSFIYDFPTITSNQTLTVERVAEVQLDTNDLLEVFHGNVVKLEAGKSSEINKMGNLITNEIYKANISTHIHGYWTQEGNSNRLEAEWSLPNVNDFINVVTLQGRLLNSKNANINDVDFQVDFDGATYNTITEKFGSSDGYSNIESYIENVVNDVSTGGTNAINNGYVYEETNNGTQTKYINFSINRKLNSEDLDDLIFGFKDNETGKYYAFSTTQDDSDKTSTGDITNSFTALRNYQTKNGNTYYNNEVNADDIVYFVDDTNPVGYFWPTVLQVQYKICNTTTSNTWSLTYNSNVTDNTVTNMPSPLTESNQVGTSIKLSSTKPERDGYVFKGWCTESNGSGTCKQAGEEMPNTAKVDMKVFAQWQKSGTEPNEKQGVMSYVIGFAAVGIITYGLYYAINKKNLFKQI